MNWKDVLGQIAQSGKFILQPNSEFGQGAYIREFTHETINVKDKSVYFKLIARPMSDMSDEELQKIVDITPKEMGYDIVNPLAYLKHFSSNDMLPARVERYLFSIGVLPEAYGDEDVIWEGKNE